MLLRSEIQRLRDAKKFVRMPYAWPGAYPQALITADGGALCSDCTRDNWRDIVAESIENTSCGFRVSGVGVNWENEDLCCDHCGAKIDSAYGESNDV